MEVNGVRRVNAKSPDILSGLPARISGLRGHVIAVVAVAPDSDGDGDYEIAPFSNRCGIAARWCIAAPGDRIRVAYFGPDPDDGSPGFQGADDFRGTSFAAPMVTGSLAVMKSYFRSQLSNTKLVERLLETANDTGIYADPAIYGEGLLDLGAATAPVGVTTIALGDLVDGPGTGLAQTRFALGGALGDGLARTLAGHEISAFDSLGAPFWYPLGAFAGAAPGPSAAARLRAFTAPRQDRETGVLRPRTAALAGGDGLSLGIMQAPGLEAGHLALAGQALTLGTARDGLSVAAFSTEGIRGQNPASGATLSWRPDGSALGLTGGWVAERETALASSPAGAFGRLSGSSAFAGIEGNARRSAPGGSAPGRKSAPSGRRRKAACSPASRRSPPAPSPSGADTEADRRGRAAVLAGAAAPRRGRAGQAHGSGRAHPGRAGAAPLSSPPVSPPAGGRSTLPPSGTDPSPTAANSASARA